MHIYTYGVESIRLGVPEEPRDIKEMMRGIRERLDGGDDIDHDALAAWSFNRLPKYLWSYWKEELKKQGITWQKFLRILRLRTADIIEWGLRDVLSWNELVRRIETTVSVYASGVGKR